MTTPSVPVPTLTDVDPEIRPLVERGLRFLERSPRGATRRDVLAALGIHEVLWATIRGRLEERPEIRVVGRGPGLRYVHARHLDAVPEETLRITEPEVRSAQLHAARVTLRDVLQRSGDIDSIDAQRLTGLRADPVRRLLLELVDEGKVERSGNKRTTRYRWVG